MKTVQILMSTYNGTKYLKEQIESILAQDCEQFGIAKIKLLIRDDGSQDETQKILEGYAAKYPDTISWYQGENVGVIRSFFDLLKNAQSSADYYSFSDQDDYWMPGKISRAVEVLGQMQEKEEGKVLPFLYCCRPKLVDVNLQELESAIERPPMRPSFGNALIENIATGCTVVINHTLYEMLNTEFPEFTVMHDWWFYLVASCFGKIYYDESSYICYRQHGGNVLGSNTSRIKELQDRIRRFKGNRNNISNQVGQFLSIFSLESVENITVTPEAREHLKLAKELLESKKSFAKRCQLVHSNKIYRQRKEDDRIFKLILRSGSF